MMRRLLVTGICKIFLVKAAVLVVAPLVLLTGSAVSNQPIEVLHFLRDGHQSLLTLNAGSNSGLEVGQRMTTVRYKTPAPSSAAMHIKTGEIKIVHVEGRRSIAEVVIDGTDLSKSVFGRLAGVMAGDSVEATQYNFERKQMILPQNEVSYYDIFVDPKAYPATFELTLSGRAELKKLAEVYSKVRQPALLIEGHTDGHGPASANQIESYQRALTVRQYLIDELGFDANRVIALGLGEAEFTDELRVPNHERTQRRIVFKVVDNIPKQARLK